MTAWLSTPLDSVFNKNFNFFVCVKTTVDMSFGDSFQMSASFLDPSEPTYDYFNYRRKDKSISFGTDTSRGLKNQITRGDVYSFAQVVSKVNTCTTVTNTVFAKETSSGQTVDADSIVPLTSVSHFIQRSVTGNTPYVTEVSSPPPAKTGVSRRGTNMSPAVNVPDASASHHSETPLSSSFESGLKWVGVTPLTLLMVTSTQ